MGDLRVLEQHRGPPPAVKQGSLIRLIAPSNIGEIIKLGFGNPEKDLPVVRELLNLVRFGIHSLESYLLFHKNKEGYETRVVSHIGTEGGVLADALADGLRELRHVGAVYLAAQGNSVVYRSEKLKVLGAGYSHMPLIVTEAALSKPVGDVFREFGCHVLID